MKKFYSFLGALATIVALAISSSACIWFFYQPRTPKSLR
ncbi:MAG TPA: cyclic lactone autoinducer peptide [Clostridia bacterium]|nr:cyclic lactone autoinducer peptide [Clostridia bacterium]